jgi:hypothetical protein
MGPLSGRSNGPHRTDRINSGLTRRSEPLGVKSVSHQRRLRSSTRKRGGEAGGPSPGRRRMAGAAWVTSPYGVSTASTSSPKRAALASNQRWVAS